MGKTMDKLEALKLSEATETTLTLLESLGELPSAGDRWTSIVQLRALVGHLHRQVYALSTK